MFVVYPIRIVTMFDDPERHPSLDFVVCEWGKLHTLGRLGKCLSNTTRLQSCHVHAATSYAAVGRLRILARGAVHCDVSNAMQALKSVQPST